MPDNARTAHRSCQCEHGDHDVGLSHPYVGVPAGTSRAMFVGPICDGCAHGHLADYVITPAAVPLAFAARTASVTPG